jgi:hypothetical protein
MPGSAGVRTDNFIQRNYYTPAGRRRSQGYGPIEVSYCRNSYVLR